MVLAERNFVVVVVWSLGRLLTIKPQPQSPTTHPSGPEPIRGEWRLAKSRGDPGPPARATRNSGYAITDNKWREETRAGGRRELGRMCRLRGRHRRRAYNHSSDHSLTLPCPSGASSFLRSQLMHHTNGQVLKCKIKWEVKH